MLLEFVSGGPPRLRRRPRHCKAPGKTVRRRRLGKNGMTSAANAKYLNGQKEVKKLKTELAKLKRKQAKQNENKEKEVPQPPSHPNHGPHDPVPSPMTFAVACIVD